MRCQPERERKAKSKSTSLGGIGTANSTFKEYSAVMEKEWEMPKNSIAQYMYLRTCSNFQRDF